MLVLGRKTDESLIVGEDIVITILGIEGDRVKVGINAPRHITILRSEVRERQLRAAAATNGEAQLVATAEPRRLR
jgi:carbon storage regulator